MPIYEFRCDACGEIFELLALNSKEQKEARCPHCGGEDLARVMSACASVVDNSPSSGASAAPQMQSRSCANSGSCATITLPGHER